MVAGCMNPIIFIDELDKVSRTEHGRELIGVLTHLTDPTQNDTFYDKYFANIPFDLSRALIVFSYNDSSLIDPILMDRIHNIQFGAYKAIDKWHIVHEHLWQEICGLMGLGVDDLCLDEKNLRELVLRYTNEAGVRTLKKLLTALAREINLQFLMGILSFPVHIDTALVERLLPKWRPVQISTISTSPRIGAAVGLYASANGIGGILNIEAMRVPSEDALKLTLTGNQGSVMKESMAVAKTVAWRECNNHSDVSYGIHVHCPEGAVPKDGPSAGLAITIALISLFDGTPIPQDIAMTGEIDLHGNVTAIGGLYAKAVGAQNAGAKTILFPRDNLADWTQILNEDDGLSKLCAYPVASLSEARKLIFST